MKTKFKTLLFFALISLLYGSCKVSYLVNYETYIEDNKDESIEYRDSLIKVIFYPMPNGIIFDIENLTENNLYLVWDKSYFIEPNGSSSKLLNTDILETNSAIREKENYESVIPQNGHFMRFTSAATKISEFSKYNSSTVYNEISKTIRTNIDYSKFYLTSKYWYTGTMRPYSYKKEIPNLDKQEISVVQKYIANNNRLALGFTIKNKEKETEYHFKLPIKKATISKKLPSDYVYNRSYELNKESGFNPIKIETKLPATN